METDERRVERWAHQAIERKWSGAKLSAIVALKGDVSTRRFWRVVIAPESSGAPTTAIAIDLGPDDLPLYARELKMYPRPLPEPPWVNVHTFLSALGVPVPALYEWSSNERVLMVEDVGSLPLFEAARSNPVKAADLYRDAVRELMRLHIDGTASTDRGCVAFQVAYDERLFAWEMRRFIEAGLGAVAASADVPALAIELSSIARELGALPRVLSHRDFHGNNLFVEDTGKIRVIDFQDALMAPAAQDLAVLLTTRDTADLISPTTEDRVLDFYFTGLIRRGASSLSHADFLRSYSLCVLQHALKCLGLFVFLEREGKRGYDIYIPHAISQARRMLARLTADFPHLRQVFGA